MDQNAAYILCNLNSRFYAENAASFSQTRNLPWGGWKRCMDACGLHAPKTEGASTTQTNFHPARAHEQKTPDHLSVLDIACGNLRYEEFLLESYPQVRFEFYAIDNCEPLVFSKAKETHIEEACANAGADSSGDMRINEKASTNEEACINVGESLEEVNLYAGENVSTEELNIHFECEDIVARVNQGESFCSDELKQTAGKSAFDLAVSFGFMHHIPGFDLRMQFLKDAVELVKPGGHLVVSFWQFMNDDAKFEKIRQTHQAALEYLTETESDFEPDVLEENDYLLGWKNLPNQYRYCHHFSDAEIDALIEHLSDKATVVERFSADGKSNNLNCYVVLLRK